MSGNDSHRAAPRYDEIVEWLDGQIIARHEWLDTHGTNVRRWPQHDIDSKRRGLAMMQAMRGHFARLVDRGAAQMEAAE